MLGETCVLIEFEGMVEICEAIVTNVLWEAVCLGDLIGIKDFDEFLSKEISNEPYLKVEVEKIIDAIC